MYSSATYATAVETGWQWLTIVSVVFFWIAFAAWVITALRAGRRIGSPPAPDRGTRLDLAPQSAEPASRAARSYSAVRGHSESLPGCYEMPSRRSRWVFSLL